MLWPTTSRARIWAWSARRAMSRPKKVGRIPHPLPPSRPRVQGQRPGGARSATTTGIAVRVRIVRAEHAQVPADQCQFLFQELLVDAGLLQNGLQRGPHLPPELPEPLAPGRRRLLEDRSQVRPVRAHERDALFFPPAQLAKELLLLPRGFLDDRRATIANSLPLLVGGGDQLLAELVLGCQNFSQAGQLVSVHGDPPAGA